MVRQITLAIVPGRRPTRKEFCLKLALMGHRPASNTNLSDHFNPYRPRMLLMAASRGAEDLCSPVLHAEGGSNSAPEKKRAQGERSCPDRLCARSIDAQQTAYFACRDSM
jgi:hypothetical protein